MFLYRQNVLKNTKIEAVSQINDMIDIIDEVAKQVVLSEVAGESLETKSPVGVKILMAR